MGIRFYCPNGHKLNVKSFLAGMRGICPHCGARVNIPLQSTRPSSKELRRQRAEAAKRSSAVAAGTVGETAAPEGEYEARVALPTDPDSSTSNPSGSPPQQASNAATVQQGGPGQIAAQQPDPLDEAPNACWYVIPPSGGQYGPASREVMRTWLSEGRIGPETLVWREGWPDWREARNVFPEVSLVGSQAVQQVVAQAVATSPLGPLSGSAGSQTQSGKRSRRTDITVVALVVAALVVLAAVLVGIVLLQ